MIDMNYKFSKKPIESCTPNMMYQVRVDPKLLGDSGEVPISERSGWRFNSCYEIFYLLDIETR